MTDNTIEQVGIIGAGIMGRGIAQIAAVAGMTVRLFDTRDGAAMEAAQFVAKMLERAVEKGRMEAGVADAAKARVIVEPDLAGLAQCGLVVEAIVENMDVKRKVFADLEAVMADDAILASNTSSLSITDIAAESRCPERVAGFHFFNPVPLMKVVEVIGGARTDASVVDRLATCAKAMGHTAVRVKDSPGFLVNHAGRGFGTEALRIASEQIADFATIDLVLRDGVGFRMGPFELLDVTGLDVSHHVMEEVYRQFYDEPRFRPSPMTRQRLAAGLLGRKTGEGFYSYDGATQQNRLPTFPDGDAGLLRSVFVAEAEDDEPRTALIAGLEDAGITIEPDPQEADLCVIMPFGDDVTTLAVEADLDPTRTVGVDPVRGFDGAPILGRVAVVMTNPATRSELAMALRVVLHRDDRPAVVIADSPGFIAQRVMGAVVNIGCEIAQQGIASPSDIDTAVRLGLGYPKGPLGLADALGPERVVDILEGIEAFYGDPRYRVSPWLKRRAMLGMSATETGG